MSYGDIVLANCKYSWISQRIKWFTRSQFSHSFITIPSILGRNLCIEAAEGGIEVNLFDSAYLNNEGEGIEIWSINIDQDIKDEALRNIMNYLEVMYGFFQYPWFMWRRLNLFFGKDIKSQDNWNKNGLICSQLCVMYIKACGLDYVLEGYGEGSVAPQDLQDIFKAHPEVFTLKSSIRLP